ncbi:hypothetical protein [Aureibacillus halotolerans]|uniref:Uncharacterized protein n=1 Tax=Aureibacillus halotolerans TaxID=1508390 RepID=A0A4R6TTG9_9BACI|nr:hypothetical protein [Aureibacillus halotolerans]TDQ36591.1 hypothetical protein EV213_11755 [Aureibacillus halotolerans]
MYRVILVLIAFCAVITSACSKQTPPMPELMSGNEEIDVYQQSYCWHLGCFDKVGGIEALEHKISTNVSPGSKMTFEFPSANPPDKIMLQQLDDHKQAEYPMTEGEIFLPDDEGTYYFEIHAIWDNGYDSFYGFVVDVRAH